MALNNDRAAKHVGDCGGETEQDAGDDGVHLRCEE
jgi:hypothetical protein